MCPILLLLLHLNIYYNPLVSTIDHDAFSDGSYFRSVHMILEDHNNFHSRGVGPGLIPTRGLSVLARPLTRPRHTQKRVPLLGRFIPNVLNHHMTMEMIGVVGIISGWPGCNKTGSVKETFSFWICESHNVDHGRSIRI